MNNLEECREKIDQIDGQILDLLALRIKVVEIISEIKKANNLPNYQPEREKVVIENIKRRAIELGLPEEYVLNIYGLILDQSKKSQDI